MFSFAHMITEVHTDDKIKCAIAKFTIRFFSKIIGIHRPIRYLPQFFPDHSIHLLFYSVFIINLYIEICSNESNIHRPFRP